MCFAMAARNRQECRVLRPDLSRDKSRAKEREEGFAAERQESMLFICISVFIRPTCIGIIIGPFSYVSQELPIYYCLNMITLQDRDYVYCHFTDGGVD